MTNFSCDYKTRLTYYQAALFMKRHKYDDSSARLNMYHCDICGAWHIGNSMKMRRLKMIKKVLTTINQHDTISYRRMRWRTN